MTPPSEQRRRARERRQAERERRDAEYAQRLQAEKQAVADAQNDLPRLLRVELEQFRPWKRVTLTDDGYASMVQLNGSELADEVIALPSVQRLLAAYRAQDGGAEEAVRRVEWESCPRRHASEAQHLMDCAALATQAGDGDAGCGDPFSGIGCPNPDCTHRPARWPS